MLPLPNLAIVVAVDALAGIPAGIRPARRASRHDLLGTIATQ